MANPGIETILKVGFSPEDDTIYPDWSQYAIEWPLAAQPHPSTGAACVLRAGRATGSLPTVTMIGNYFTLAEPGEEGDVLGISDGLGGLIFRPGRTFKREGLISAWKTNQPRGELDTTEGTTKWNHEKAIRRLLQLGFSVTSTDVAYVPPSYNNNRPFIWAAYQFLFVGQGDGPYWDWTDIHNKSKAHFVNGTPDNTFNGRAALRASPEDKTVITRLQTFTNGLNADTGIINYGDDDAVEGRDSLLTTIQELYDESNVSNSYEQSRFSTMLLCPDIEPTRGYPVYDAKHGMAPEPSEPWDSEYNSQVLFRWSQMYNWFRRKNRQLWNNRFLMGAYGGYPFITTQGNLDRMFDHADAFASSGRVVPIDYDLTRNDELGPPQLYAHGQYQKSDALHYLIALKDYEKFHRLHIFAGYVSQVFGPELIVDPTKQNSVNGRATWLIGDRLEIFANKVQMIADLHAHYLPGKPFIAEIRLCAIDPTYDPPGYPWTLPAEGLGRSVTGDEVTAILDAVYPLVDGIQFWNYPWAHNPYTNIDPEAIDAIEDFARAHPDNVSGRLRNG